MAVMEATELVLERMSLEKRGRGGLIVRRIFPAPVHIRTPAVS